MFLMFQSALSAFVGTPRQKSSRMYFSISLTTIRRFRRLLPVEKGTGPVIGTRSSDIDPSWTLSVSSFQSGYRARMSDNLEVM